MKQGFLLFFTKFTRKNDGLRTVFSLGQRIENWPKIFKQFNNARFLSSVEYDADYDTIEFFIFE